jgi:hypothetical protein
MPELPDGSQAYLWSPQALGRPKLSIRELIFPHATTLTPAEHHATDDRFETMSMGESVAQKMRSLRDG